MRKIRGSTQIMAGTITADRLAFSISQTSMLLSTVDGVCEVHSGKHRVYNRTGRNVTISEIFLSIDTPPTGSSLTIDINQNGTSIGTTTSILDGQYTGSSSVSVVWVNGNYLTVDTDLVGSTVAGSDLVVHIVYQ